MPQTPPKDIVELLAGMQSISPAKFSMAQFNYFHPFGTENGNLNKYKGGVFKDGNYAAENGETAEDVEGVQRILTGSRVLGLAVITKAKALGINPENLPELKYADLNGDGKADLQEIGALLLAASMKTEITEKDGVYTVTSTFDNKLDRKEIEALRDPETVKSIALIAKKLLADNGVAIPATPEVESNAAFAAAMGALSKAGRPR